MSNKVFSSCEICKIFFIFNATKFKIFRKNMVFFCVSFWKKAFAIIFLDALF